MSSHRPPACIEKAYIEIDLELLRETGEVRPIGSPIIAPTITQKVPRGKFEITYTAELFNILKELGNKKIEILSYMLDHKDGNNSLNMSNSEIAKVTNSSRTTVVETMTILKNANLVTRKGTVLMINPNLMVKGNQLREAWLMRKYEEINYDEIEPKALPFDDKSVIDVEIDPQYSFTENGEIVQSAR